MTVRRAITFGQKYRQEEHERLGPLAHPDGYIVVEAETYEQVREFLVIICGREDLGPGQRGAVLFAFDYDLEEFEAPGGSAEKWHPRGRLAEFSALPRPAVAPLPPRGAYRGSIRAGTANLHTLSKFALDGNAPSSHFVTATCSCHNPDENGEGRMDFAGPTVEDVADLWYDHLTDVLERKAAGA